MLFFTASDDTQGIALLHSAALPSGACAGERPWVRRGRPPWRHRQEKNRPTGRFQEATAAAVLIAARDLSSVDDFDLKGAFALLAHDVQRQDFAFLKAAQNAHGVTGIPGLALTDL